MDLSAVYFPSAVLIGGLHALEPGHAKTLTAAFLIGTKGTKRDAAVLGLAVAFTHSIVVIGLSVIAVSIGREAFTGEASYFLALGSSVLVILLGLWLFTRRLRALRRAKNALSHSQAHSHGTEPVVLSATLLKGELAIVDSPSGEKFQFRGEASGAQKLEVVIFRPGGTQESHVLALNAEDQTVWQSLDTPEEPHEFSAELRICAGEASESVAFSMNEAEHHEHDHALLSDEEHARAHMSDLPDYVKRGERPTLLQILAFGAVGGLVPCPAAVSVMLLSLSLSQSGKGLFMVLGFSLGLALTLVGIGLIVVTGVSKLAASGRLSRFSAYAPLLAATMVLISGSVGIMSAIINRP